MLCKHGVPNHLLRQAQSVSQWSAFHPSHLSVQSRVVDLVLDRFQQAEAIPCALTAIVPSFKPQSRVVDLVLDRFQQAEAEDLPALARFLLQHAAPGAELKKARVPCLCWRVVCFCML